MRYELSDYQPYHATAADLLQRTGKHADVVLVYGQAITLTNNPVERDFLAAQRSISAARR